MQPELCVHFRVGVCASAFRPGLHSSPGNKKQCFSLKSDPAFYRVELLIADNPAAPPTLCHPRPPLLLAPPQLLSYPVQCLHLNSFTLSSYCLSVPSLRPPPLYSLRPSREGSRSAAPSLRVVLVGAVGGVALSPTVPVKQIMC